MQKSETTTFPTQKKENIALVNNFSDEFVKISCEKDLPTHDTPIKTDSLIVAICLKGKVDVKINMEDFQLEPCSIAIILPGSFIKVEEVPLPLSLDLIKISDEFLQMNIGLKQCIWKNGGNFYKNPIVKLKQEHQDIFTLYLELLTFISQGKPALYKQERLQSILIAMLYEMLSSIEKEGEAQSIDIHNNETTAARKFVEMLIRDEGKHRSVEYYAKALCYTPKHFCSLIKKAMGQTPLKIINDHAAERIKHDLMYTSLDLNNIAEKYNFTNYSFFGKFVKKHLGVCPKIYRRNHKR